MATLPALLLLPYVLSLSLAAADELTVPTKTGHVRGKMLPVLGDEVRAFLGIPYAKPPVGPLRFRHPEPADSWTGVKEATSYGNTCYQLADTAFPGFRGAEMWNPNTAVSEDCLYLNIWTPRLNGNGAKGPLPVMIWIYGGGFTTGTSSLDLYDGRYLAHTEDVIVVSMNYRLSVFGFLAIQNNNKVTGNAALMDQRLAIQWTVDNIAAFGGDPSQITLFGESAGSACVGFHVISPGSNVLFKRAVMESGVPTAPWATMSLEETWKRAIKLGTLVNCATTDPADLEACLQTVDPAQLVTAQFGTVGKASLGGYPFVPVVDGHFLPDTLDNLMKMRDNKKEILLGLNENEGSYFLIYSIPGYDLGDSLITKKQAVYGLELIFGEGIAPYTDSIISAFSLSSSDAAEYRDMLERLTSDILFHCPVQQFAKGYGKYGGTPFLYHFLHRSSINPWPEWMGVMHGYEIEFVFGMPLNPSLGYTQEEVNMSKRFMTYWANFARTGNPGVAGQPWPIFTESKSYVTLDTHAPEFKSNLRSSECSTINFFLS